MAASGAHCGHRGPNDSCEDALTGLGIMSRSWTREQGGKLRPSDSLEEMPGAVGRGPSCQSALTQSAMLRRGSLLSRASHQTWIDRDRSAIQRALVATPPWSLEDRYARATLTLSWGFSLLRSNFVLGALYVTYLLCELGSEPQGRSVLAAFVIAVFVFLHVVVTLLQGIPNNSQTNVDVDAATSASTFIAMVLYPCLGLWVIGRGSAWHISCVDDLWTFTRESEVEWGMLFPCLLWGMSACILLRDSNHAFTIDTAQVVLGANKQPQTALFRRSPGAFEVFTSNFNRVVTATCWDVFDQKRKPSGGLGRFVMQLISPVSAIFLYVGLRFIAFGAQQGAKVFLHSDADLVKGLFLYGMRSELLQAYVIVWAAFLLHCILVRAILPNPYFLRLAVADPVTAKAREASWACTLAHGKRQRVLWATRGLMYGVLLLMTQHNFNLGPLGRYTYLVLHISYMAEGAAHIVLAFREAERGCGLRTPFDFVMRLCFWCAFNVYLQPPGSLINAVVSIVNQENKKGVVLLEIWGPLVRLPGRVSLDGQWLGGRTSNLENAIRRRYKNDEMDEDSVQSDICCPCRRRNHSEADAKTAIEARVTQWEQTFRRKRLDAGRNPDSITIVPEGPPIEQAQLPSVFHGTVFPRRAEWRFMRNNCEQFLVLQPWDRQRAADKFLEWYPASSEEVVKLLRRPHDFELQQEVWMFGYGSLMSPDCPPAGLTRRQRKLIIPYWLRKEAGYRRVWNFRHGACEITAYGLEKVDGIGDDICGCVYPMDYEKASELFSHREDGYELLLVHESFMAPMHDSYVVPKGIGYVWMCGTPTSLCGDPCDVGCSQIACKRHVPTVDAPVLQSYIDSLMRGALRYRTEGLGQADGMRFAAALVMSTRGWDYPWYNDRLVSGRPWNFCPDYDIIDGILSTCPTSRDSFVNRRRSAHVPCEVQRQLRKNQCDRFRPWAASFFNNFEHNLTVPHRRCELEAFAENLADATV